MSKHHDKKKPHVGEQVANFWLGMVGAAADGFAQATRAHRERRADGKDETTLRSFAYVFAVGAHQALKSASESAKVTEDELEKSLDGKSDAEKDDADSRKGKSRG